MKDTVRLSLRSRPAERPAKGGGTDWILAATGAKVSWAKPHNLHLTLKFLDEIRWNDIADVTRAVEQAAESAERFELKIRGAGAFPNPGRPRTLCWAPLPAATAGRLSRRAGESLEAARLSQGASPLCRSSHAGPRSRRRAGHT